MLHVVPSPGPALMIVAKAVAGVPTCTDRLAGSTDAKSWIEDCVGLKLAVTPTTEFIVTVQGPLPLQAPPQPLKLKPAFGVGVSVTLIPPAILAVQTVPQVMPPV